MPLVPLVSHVSLVPHLSFRRNRPASSAPSPRRRSHRLVATLPLALVVTAGLSPMAAAAPTRAPAPITPAVPDPAPADLAGSSASPGAAVAETLIEPGPSPDPWYHQPPPDAAIAPGTVLDSREVVIPNGTLPTAHRAWQLRLRSTDAHDRPMSVVTTVVVPEHAPADSTVRPLVSLDTAIDGLGRRCAPSWTLLHDEPDRSPGSHNVPDEMLRRGWAVVVTDHEGPRMAYAAGRLAGHAVLDGVRAARSFAPAELAGSPVVLNGYSGGAIASGWAAELQPAYAPELTDALVGVVAGGTPSDPSLLFDTMDARPGAGLRPGSGLFRAAILGMAREYDELPPLFTRLGLAVVATTMRDMCARQGEMAAVVQVPISQLAAVPDLRAEPAVRAVLADNRMGASAPTAPVLLFHGSPSVGIGDQFIPEAGVLALRDRWCAGGADVEYLPVLGEHMMAPLVAHDRVLAWMADRFTGAPRAPGCQGAGPPPA